MPRTPRNTGKDELFEAFRDLAERIERGFRGSVTLKYMTTDGTEHEHFFSLETDEERTVALLTLRQILGQVH